MTTIALAYAVRVVTGRLWRPIAAAVAVLAWALSAAPSAAAEVLVFAAASATTALTEIAEIAKRQGLATIVPSFASSSALAKQIDNGAPADIFVSANVRWMDYLESRNAIDGKSRIDLIGNDLVLIAPRGGRLAASPAAGAITKDYPLAARLEDGRLAIGDPAHVPAGIYAKQALEWLGLWAPVADRLAPVANVRAALALVERGEAEAGIVYATDAKVVVRKVVVIGIFPARSHTPIVYPAAIVAGRERDEVRRVFTLLASAEAATVFARHGFTPLAARPYDGSYQDQQRRRSGMKRRR